jgi:hypothetical protein
MIQFFSWRGSIGLARRSLPGPTCTKRKSPFRDSDGTNLGRRWANAHMFGGLRHSNKDSSLDPVAVSLEDFAQARPWKLVAGFPEVA